MSGTPRTDDAAKYYCAVVPADFAADLERELNAAKAEVDRLREALEAMTAEFDSGDVNAGEWAAIQKARAALKETK